MKPKEPGTYWARRRPDMRWEAVQIDEGGHVSVPGSHLTYSGDSFVAWGPRIEPPKSELEVALDAIRSDSGGKRSYDDFSRKAMWTALNALWVREDGSEVAKFVDDVFALIEQEETKYEGQG